MTTSRKNIIKEYHDGAWPGASVFLLEQAGYLDLFVSADDGHTYKVRRVASIEAASAAAAAYYADLESHFEQYLCPECGECTCDGKACPIDLQCTCKRP